jgi:hypothetical protein
MPPRKTAVKQPGDDALIERIAHKEGCPADRTEAYDAKRPGGVPLRVGRCIECGEYATKEVNSATAEDDEDNDN